MQGSEGGKEEFDVFLSHNSKDKPSVRLLAEALSRHGIKVWLDEDQLIPGRPWQKLLEDGIRHSHTGAVLVGHDGIGPWENEEMRVLLDQAVRAEKPVIPVLLPGAPAQPRLPLFLANRTWVDLRSGMTPENLARLIWGITGDKPAAESATGLQKKAPPIDAQREQQSSDFVQWVGRSDYNHLAIVFTDIIGSTRLNRTLGEHRWNAIRDGHFAIARRLVRCHGGYLVKTVGDAVMAVFRDSVAALTFAREFEASPGGEPVRIRVGVHVGRVYVQAGDTFGTEVNFAARVSGMGKEGGIWVSAPVRQDWIHHDPRQQLPWIEHQDVELAGFDQRYTLWSLPPSKRPAVAAATQPASPLPSPPQVRAPSIAPPPIPGQVGFKADLSRIVKYAPAELIGREDELQLLHDAWSGEHSSAPAPPVSRFTFHSRPHVLTFVALGGEGKTSLVAKWAAELAAQDWPGCDAAFAWSFYSQGTREQLAASSDLFLKEALAFFGDEAMAQSAAGAFNKGRRLAELVGGRRALLILDGLEPLQYPPTAPTPGELKDQGVAALLKGLAAAGQGLCVVTTRYSLPDLRAFRQTTAPEVKLQRLSRAAGVQLLKTLGVIGRELRNIPFNGGRELVNEFEKLVEDVQGHALTLNLLGTYLRDAHGGDIRRRDQVKLEEADAEEQAGHAFRAMDAYVRWLEQEGTERTKNQSSVSSCSHGQRALALLRLIGLFDRPATADCLAALLQPPAIPGLTAPLVDLTEAQLNMALSRLESARLITIHRDPSATPHLPHSAFRIPHSLDAHPHIREYFAKLLRDENTEAWRAAHRRLYEHLCDTTPDKPEPTLEDLQPLYQAVAHGCQAGATEEARAKVFLDRVRRGGEAYSLRKLGAFGSDLGAIASLFERPWIKLLPGIYESRQAWLFNEAAFCLRALGRLTEALEPMRAGLEMGVKQENWESAATRASNLSELELTLGEVAAAVRDAEQSVTYADRSGDTIRRIITHTTHADALHQAGRSRRSNAQAEQSYDAETLFREAEQMQKERQPDYSLLYSLRGFQYCDLLLAAPERAAWQQCSAGVSPAGSPGVPPGGSGGETPPELAAGTAALLSACRTVSQRAAQTLQWWMNHFTNASLLDIALDHLTLGRAALYEAILDGSAAFQAAAPSEVKPALDSPSAPVVASSAAGRMPARQALQTARRELDAAVAGLRHANRSDYLPRGLLTRAWLRFLEGKPTGPASAQEDLDESWEIAERGPMRLFMADIHLYRARLFGSPKSEVQGPKYPWQSPQADLAAAEKLINQCGYYRRDAELADAKAALARS